MTPDAPVSQSPPPAREISPSFRLPILVWLISLYLGVGGGVGTFVNISALLGLQFAIEMRADSYGPLDFLLYLVVSLLSLAAAISLFRLRPVAWPLMCSLFVCEFAVRTYESLPGRSALGVVELILL